MLELLRALASLIPYGEPATADRDFSLPGAVAYFIARALYRNPAPRLVPVACQRGRRSDIGVINCIRLTVVADDGQTFAMAGGRDNCEPPAGLRQQEFRPTNAQTITAHLRVTYPDDSCRTVDLSLDIFCDGEIYEEAVWLTDAWQPDQIDELQEILFQAYWEADNPEQCRDPEAYEDEMTVLATRLLAGGRPALQAQLEQLCNGFYPGGNWERIPVMTAVNGRNIIIWQPAQPDSENPPPPWLTAAVAANHPDLDRDAVLSHARAIWSNETRRKQLLDTLRD